MTVNKNSILLFRIISDIFLVNLSFLVIQYFISTEFSLSLPKFNFLLFLNLGWIISGKFNYLYDDFRSRTFTYQVVSIIKNSIILLIIMMVVFFFFKNQFLSRPRVFIISYSTLLLFLIILKEYFLRHLFAYLRKKGINKRNIIIIGANEIGYRFSHLIQNHPHFGYDLLGFIDDNNYNLNLELLGDFESLEKILLKYPVHEIFIALKNTTDLNYDKTIRICNKHAIKVKIIPDYLRFLSKKFKATTFGEFPIIVVRDEPLEEVQWRILKRIFDVAFSGLFILLLFTWVFPFIALIQKLDSKGPIFFIQDRVGKHNKVFKCLKFRTMFQNSDQKYNATTKGDPRITKFGSFLRRTNLDEIPQFINVFLGDMSVVGPRPHALDFNQKYSEFVEEIKMRHSVKPGITGWAQINGYRGDAVDEEENRIHTREKIRSDLYYIENWSFWLDLNIIFLTVWNMIKGDPNAY